jgi:hypothetical protein
MNKPSLNRRRFLRASGIALALPAMPSLLQGRSLGMSEATDPLRLCYLYVPNGVNMQHWRPSGDANGLILNRSTASLEPHKDHLRFVSGLTHQHAFAGNDGGGDHARAHATFLTGQRAYKTAGADIRVGVSADQVVAQHFAETTRLRSLELSCDGVRKSGQCDSGYACAYQFNLAWADERTPVAPESNPRSVFERLFGVGTHGERKQNYEMRQASQRSMLDFLKEETNHIQRALGAEDRLKLDEYLTGIRDIESRIQKAERFGLPADPNHATPVGVPESYRDHIRLMADVLALALETDSTRVATFMLAHDGSNRSFRDIDIGDGHHDLSHHQKNEQKLEKIARIDTFYVEQLAYFLSQLQSRTNQRGQSLLDNTLVVFGSGISDGDRHNHDDLPVILAGGKGIGIRGNVHQVVANNTPMANLHLELIHRMGVSLEAFGDSTGRLPII